MNELFVTKAVYARKADNSGAFAEGAKYYTINNATAATSLMAGAIVFINDRDEILVSGADAYLNDVKKVRVMLGRGLSEAPFISEPFERGETKVEYQIYTAPQKQVTVVGDDTSSAFSLNLPSPLIPTGHDSLGYAAIIEVRRTDDLSKAGNQWDAYQVPIPPYIAGAAAQVQATYIITQLVTKINNNSQGFVVAAAIGGVGTEDGIQLTASDYGITFEVNTLGLLEYSDIVTPTQSTTIAKNMILGCGRPYQIAEIERIALPEKGYTDKMTPSQWNTWSEASQVSMLDSCGYEVLTLWKQDFPTGVGEMNKMLQKKMNLKVAIEGTLAGGVPTGAYTATPAGLKTALDALLPLIFGHGAYLSGKAAESGTDIV